MVLTHTIPQSQNRVSVPARTAVSDTAGVVATAKTGRMLIRIQNTGATTIYLNFSTTLPTATVYHVALSRGTGADDGSGGAISLDAWSGSVTALSSAAGGTMVITEVLAPPSWE